MPRRIQIQRKKGWRKPDGAVYVGRPSKWCNPYKLSDYSIMADGTSDKLAPKDVQEREARAMAVRDFEAWIFVGHAPYTREDIRRELRGAPGGAA